MNTMLIKRGVLRAGGWGNGPIIGLDTLVTYLSHVVLNEISAGPQSLARSISRAIQHGNWRIT